MHHPSSPNDGALPSRRTFHLCQFPAQALDEPYTLDDFRLYFVWDDLGKTLSASSNKVRAECVGVQACVAAILAVDKLSFAYVIRYVPCLSKMSGIAVLLLPLSVIYLP